jgi:meiotic recombination protein SPO11
MATNQNEPDQELQSLRDQNSITEVSVMSAVDVSALIEAHIMKIAHTILQGDGFSLMVPSRSSANTLYLPKVDRIVLKDKLSERVFSSIKNGRKTALTVRILQLVYELCRKGIHVTKR